MKYMWSKNRIAKYLLPIILKDRKEWQWYVEPFVWGANMIDKVDGNRIWSDFNKYLACFLQWLSKWKKYSEITKEKYIDIKNKYQNESNNPYSLDLIWYAWICASYSWKWFWWYAWKVETKWWLRNYQAEAIKNIEKQDLSNIIFKYSSYQDLEIPDNSIIYCDPPYESTTWYKDKFSHNEFFEWAREKKKEWHTIFISEYNAPDDFKCVWEKEVKSSLSANWKSGGSKNSIEKLFTI